MTTLHSDPTSSISHPPATPAPTRVLRRLGGLALGAAPVLLGLAMVTTPPQESGSNTDYVTSLAADRLMTAVSADFYHYAFVCFAFGALATVTLVRGRRGRFAVPLLAVLTAVSSVQLSGLMLSDFYLASIPRHADVATAAAVLDDLGPTISSWFWTAQPAGVLVLLLPLALARAGQLRWVLAVLPVGTIALIAVPLPWPLLLTVQVLLSAPYFVLAHRLVRR